MAKIVTTISSSGATSVHNQLSGLNEGDYLHLTEEEKINLENVVHKTGNEPIDGVKTFVQSPIVPTATQATQAVNLGQLNLQTVLEEGNFSDKGIVLQDVPGTGIDILAGNKGINIQSNSIGISVTGDNIGIIAEGVGGKAGVFSIGELNTNNIVEFRTEDVGLQAYITHEGKVIGANLTGNPTEDKINKNQNNGYSGLDSGGKIPFANLPTITKSDVGLSNVDNTTDLNKPVSTAQQTALNLKANLASPTFTGSVIVPNATLTTQAVNLGQVQTGYLTIVSSATPVTLTASSPRFIIVTGTLAQTINLPVTSTLSLGYQFNIINTSTNTTTVNSSGGNAMPITIANGTSCNFYCILTTGTTASSWQQEFTGSPNRTGNGNLVYGSTPSILLPSLQVSPTFTAGTNAQGQGQTSLDVIVVTSTPSSPSGVTLVGAGTASRTQTIINKGTNPVNVYPASGTTIDALGVNNPYLLPVNGVMVFRSVSGTQWYSEIVIPNLSGTNTGDQNENNVYGFHDFLTTLSNESFALVALSSGTLNANANNVTINNAGVARVTSSATANSGFAIRGSGATRILKGGEVTNFIFNPLTFANTTLRDGIHDATTSTAPNNGVYFEYSGSGVLSIVTANNGTRTTSTVTTLVVNTWYKLRITVNANATSVLAEVFDNVGASITSQTVTTNIPDATRIINRGVIVSNSTTTATNLVDVDFISTKITLTR